MYYIGFPISALIYMLIFIIIYFAKKRVNLFENKLLIGLMFWNIVGIILEILGYYINLETNLKLFVLKTYNVYIAIFIMLLNAYISILTNHNYGHKDFNAKNYFYHNLMYYSPIFILLIILIYQFPLKVHQENNLFYPYGTAVKLLFFVNGIMIIIWLIKCLIAIISRKDEDLTRYYAIIIGAIIITTVGSITQFINQSVLITTFVHSVILAIIYFTIENPDLKMVKELAQAKKNADAANTAKREFLSSMTHEIRTPLNTVINSAEILTSETLSNDGKDALNDLKQACNSLLDLGSGIIDVNAIEAGNAPLNEMTYHPYETFNTLISILKKKLQNNVYLFTDYAADLPVTLYGDIGKIKEIITNLVTNAIKFTTQGQITIAFKCVNVQDTCQLIISVKDTGSGIDNEVLNNLFKQYDINNHNIKKGSGLGLVITKKLIDILGGKITVSSVVNVGSTFTCFINQRIILEPNIILPKIKEVNSFNNLNKILIVDDDKMNLNVEQKLLKKLNINVDTCQNGEECLAKIKSGAIYDLILMDDLMPKMSGTATLKHLRDDYKYLLPVVVLTANAESTDRDNYLQAGFDGYLPKPVTKDTLYKTIGKYLK
jgi:signal transduction histidine kinase